MAIVALKIEGDLAKVEQAIDTLKKVGLEVEMLETEEEFVPWREAFPGVNIPVVCLKEMRLLAELTQQQLSELTGVPQRHISEMENGKRPIGKENAKKFAKALKTNYQMFL